MTSSLLLGWLVSAALVGVEASPAPAVTTRGDGILTPPRLRFTPPTSRRRSIDGDPAQFTKRLKSPLQVLLHVRASRRSGPKFANELRIRRQNIDEQFINSRAIQFATAKRTAINTPSKVTVTEEDGSGFWPPWPFNHLKKNGRSVDDGGVTENGRGGGKDYQQVKLFWRYISHRARVGARQIQQREFSLNEILIADTSIFLFFGN